MIFIRKKRTDFPVDMVILWCNGNEAGFLAEKEYWAKQEGIENKLSNHQARFIENDELRYIFRGVEQNAPWIRYIWLVTNGQKPNWLNLAHSKVRLVTHTQFMPRKVLPTFNSVAIESVLHKIDGLAEHFLYGNDDTFIWRPIQKSLFFPKENLVYNYYLERHKWLMRQDISIYEEQLYTAYKLIYPYAPQLLRFLTPYHNIDGYLKSSFACTWNMFPAELADTLSHKFRQRTDIQRWIFSAVAWLEGKAVWKAIHRRCLRGDIGRTYELRQDYAFQIKRKKPYLLCLNDSEKCTQQDRERLKYFLQSRFPAKSSFEI